MKPCPFCGKPVDLNDPDTLYPINIFWVDNDDVGRTYSNHFNHEDTQCWSIHCVESAGGCGVEMTGDGKEDAIAKWERRK